MSPAAPSTISPAACLPDFGHFGHPDGPALWGYARNAPGMMVDPRGEWWFGTAIAGGVINMAGQVGWNMLVNGQDFRTAVQNIDYRQVLVSASLGFVAPGWAGLAFNPSQPGIGALVGYQTFIGLTGGFTNKAISMGPNEPWRYDLPGAIECFWQRWRIRNSILWAYGI